jgi:hypothetical protein
MAFSLVAFSAANKVTKCMQIQLEVNFWGQASLNMA